MFGSKGMRAVDAGEFGRFAITGVTATVGNLGAVWLARRILPFELALLAGIAAGLTISFLLSKLFAFESRSWGRAGGEAARFLVVYAVGCVLYWSAAVFVGRVGVTHGTNTELTEMAGVLFGAGVMMVTTYFGHRFFTYKTHRLPPAASDPDL